MIRICWYLIYGHFLSGHKNIGRLRYYCGSTPESVERRAVSAGENLSAHVSLIAHTDQLPRPSVIHVRKVDIIPVIPKPIAQNVATIFKFS